MKAAWVTGALCAATMDMWLSPAAMAQTPPEMRAAAPLSDSFDAGNSCVPGDAADRSEGRGSWNFTWENDAIAAFSGSDEFYTQGIRLGYDFATGASPRWLAAQAYPLCSAVERLLDIGRPEQDRRGWTSGVYLGQHIFTPGVLSEPNLIPDDRPYAGWLYLGERISVRSVLDERRVNYHAFDLQIGLVGPQAQGEWAQRDFHKLIGDELPLGWDNQVPNEPHVFASYRFTRRNLVNTRDAAIEVDWMPAYEIGLGTLQVYAEPSLTLRIGRALGEPPMGNLNPRAPIATGGLASRASEGFDARASEKKCATGWGPFAIEECFIYGRIAGRAVAHNVFLDGTVWHDSHSVDKDPFFYDWAVGFRLRWRTIEMDYEFVRRSREFSPVPATASNDRGTHDYGSLSVQCREWLGWACPTFFGLLLSAVAAQ